MSGLAGRGRRGLGEHLVDFYETDESLAGAVARFLAPALRDGSAAIVVGTPAHRAAVEVALAAGGVDVALAVAAGVYLTFDAAELLETFLVDGALDAGLFNQQVGSILEGATMDGRAPRIYGEMVALLWERGDPRTAVALEDLWNDLAVVHHFDLLCGYRMQAFGDEATAVAFKRICQQHQVRPEQEILAELAYVDALTAAVNRRAQTQTMVPCDLAPVRGPMDRPLLAAWRRSSPEKTSPGGLLLDDIIDTELLLATDRPGLAYRG